MGRPAPKPTMVGSQVLPIAAHLTSLLSDLTSVLPTILTIGTEVPPILSKILTGVPQVLPILLEFPGTGPLPFIHSQLLTVMTNRAFILPQILPVCPDIPVVLGEVATIAA